MDVGVYELNGRGTGEPFYLELPESLLPPGGPRVVEEEEPGYFKEYPRWIRLQTGKLSSDGRLPVFLYKNQMEKLNIDLNKMPSIKIQGLPYIWFDGHLIYRWGPLPFYGRVWIPRRVVEALRLRPESPLLVKIRGTTFPRRRRVTVVERYVEVEHMTKIYKAELRNNRWIWIIPSTIEAYEVIGTGLKKNYMPIAECKNHHGRILIDLKFRPLAAPGISQTIGYAYRTMSVRNYSSDAETNYPLLFEIRATMNLSLPKQYPQQDILMVTEEDGTERVMTMKDALDITVDNMVSFFTTSLRHAEKKHKVSYETEGYENKRISAAEIEGQFYYVEKYVRIVNEYYSKKGIEKEYFNDEIENVLSQKDEYITIDDRGFVWMKQEEE